MHNADNLRSTKKEYKAEKGRSRRNHRARRAEGSERQARQGRNAHLVDRLSIFSPRLIEFPYEFVNDSLDAFILGLPPCVSG